MRDHMMEGWENGERISAEREWVALKAKAVAADVLAKGITTALMGVELLRAGAFSTPESAAEIARIAERHLTAALDAYKAAEVLS